MTSSIPTGAGSPPAKAGFCSECGAALTAGAKFCHRCGTPFGEFAEGAPSTKMNLASALPWGMAAVALILLVVVLASRSGNSTESGVSAGAANADVAPFAGSGASGGPAGGQPPDIGSMTPSERANRLYVRVMEYAEAGKADSVARFAPMVLAAHQMLQQLTADERYHYGRVAEVVGTPAITKAQADTMLTEKPTSLLGLLLAARAARLEQNEPAARAFDKRLLAALETELATGNPDYANHRAEIDQTVAVIRRSIAQP